MVVSEHGVCPVVCVSAVFFHTQKDLRKHTAGSAVSIAYMRLCLAAAAGLQRVPRRRGLHLKVVVGRQNSNCLLKPMIVQNVIWNLHASTTLLFLHLMGMCLRTFICMEQAKTDGRMVAGGCQLIS